MVLVAIYLAREDVARTARHVVGEHEDDVTVGDAQSLHRAIEGQGVGYVPVVEPKARRVNQHRPVVGVVGGGKEGARGIFFASTDGIRG